MLLYLTLYIRMHHWKSKRLRMLLHLTFCMQSRWLNLSASAMLKLQSLQIKLTNLVRPLLREVLWSPLCSMCRILHTAPVLQEVFRSPLCSMCLILHTAPDRMSCLVSLRSRTQEGRFGLRHVLAGSDIEDSPSLQNMSTTLLTPLQHLWIPEHKRRQTVDLPLCARCVGVWSSNCSSQLALFTHLSEIAVLSARIPIFSLPPYLYIPKNTKWVEFCTAFHI